MNRFQASQQTGSFADRLTRFLIRGPAAVRGPAARWTVNVLALAGAALLIWSSVIHLQLWSEGYKDISVIGPLFLAQGIGAIVIAAVMLLFRWQALLVAGAVTLIATAVGLLLSAYIGLFGYTESLAVPDAQTSLGVEFAGGAVLLAAAAILLIAPRRSPVPAAGTRQASPSLADDRM